MTTVSGDWYFTTEIQDLWDAETNASQREKLFWYVLNIKSTFAMISNEQLISVTEFTGIDMTTFWK